MSTDRTYTDITSEMAQILDRLAEWDDACEGRRTELAVMRKQLAEAEQEKTRLADQLHAARMAEERQSVARAAAEKRADEAEALARNVAAKSRALRLDSPTVAESASRLLAVARGLETEHPAPDDRRALVEAALAYRDAEGAAAQAEADRLAKPGEGYKP